MLKALAINLSTLVFIGLFWISLAEIDGTEHFLYLAIISVLLSFVIAYFLASLPESYNNPFKFIFYSLWLFKEIILSSIAVSKIILTPGRMKISPRIVEIETNIKSDASKVLYANSITLTPGTYTLDLNDNKLLVHCLTTSNIRDLASNVMQDRINKL